MKNNKKYNKFQNMLKLKLHNKKFKYNSMITIFVVIFISLAFVLNLIVSMLVKTYDLKVDLTAFDLYKISDETKEFLNKYDKEAKITVLNDEEAFKKADDVYTKHIYNIVKNFAACSSKIKLEFVNLNEQPTFAAKYSNLSLQPNGILISCAGKNAKFIPISKMFQRQYDEMGLNENQVISNVEKNIAYALEFVSEKDKVKIFATQGHGEIDVLKIHNTFLDNGYQIESLNLLTTKMPNEADLIFIVAPNIDFKEEEISKLEDFIKSGKNIVYFASAIQPELKNLERFFNVNCGVSFHDGVVIETDQNKMSLNGVNDIFLYAENDNKYTENTSSKRLPININDCKPMEIQNNKKDAVVIAKTNDSSAVLKKDAKKIDLNNLEKKSFPFAVGVTKKIDDKKTAKITILSSVNILSGMEVPQFGNGDFVLNVLGETSGHKSKISVLPKVIGIPRLAVPKTYASIIAFVVMLVIPLSVVMIGVFVYQKRKRR